MSESNGVLPCALEVIMTLRKKELYPDDTLVARELGLPLPEARRLMEEAIRQGLIIKRDGYYELTDEGLKRVIRHRELFVHDHFVHKDDRWSSAVVNWSKHWRWKHGLTRGLLDDFYRTLADLEGRVEELKPLSAMKPGEEGVVVSIACGLGAAKRLAEMGLTPGTRVLVTRRAPLRGPIEVEVRGTRIALGYGLASKIAVKSISETL
ncbi:MAG: FeoA family protein [Candidatus Nezhaarchaeales archaeon]